jgi:hypothetical protein
MIHAGVGVERNLRSAIILNMASKLLPGKMKKSVAISLTVYLLLVFFQIKTTNIKEAYSFTPAEIDQQIQRMNLYPPSLARLGYVLEAKREVQLLNKVVENFFFVVDFGEYFPNRLPYILSPFFLLGLYVFAKGRKKRKTAFISFLATIVTLTILGPHGKYGPVLIMPYLILFIILGFIRTFGYKKI